MSDPVDDLIASIDTMSARGDAPRTETPDLLDRLMELWQEPWSELAFGEAQMLVARLRTVLSGDSPSRRGARR